MLESSNNPLFVRQDTPTHFEFRIRNLPYPADTYQLSVDDATQEIILRTSNKKYYKRISIPDLRAGAGDAAKLDAKGLTHRHANNTLIISYAKPAWVRDLEARNRLEIRRMGNGSTTATGQAGAVGQAGQSAKPLTAAQKLLADAQASSKAEEEDNTPSVGLITRSTAGGSSGSSTGGGSGAASVQRSNHRGGTDELFNNCCNDSSSICAG